MHRFPFCFTRYLGIWPSSDATLLTRFSKERMYYYLVNLFSPQGTLTSNHLRLKSSHQGILHVHTICKVYDCVLIILQKEKLQYLYVPYFSNGIVWYLTKPVLEKWAVNINSLHVLISLQQQQIVCISVGGNKIRWQRKVVSTCNTYFTFEKRYTQSIFAHYYKAFES